VLYTCVALTQAAALDISRVRLQLGIVPQMMAAMHRPGGCPAHQCAAFAALKWCGVVYLLYMAWQALRETGCRIDKGGRERVEPAVIVTAILINHPNPKLSIFFPGVPAAVHRADEPSVGGGCWN